MIQDLSGKARVDPRAKDLFDRYAFTYFPAWPTSELPPQRCSDADYIPDQIVLDCYRNLHQNLIDHKGYTNPVVDSMVDYSFWLATSMTQRGIQAPLNMYHWTNIHPGKKRYIMANYLQIKTVPVLVQHWPGNVQRAGGIPVTSLDYLLAIYQNNVSVNVREKVDELLVECSWHGETQRRDRNGYDDWYSAAAHSIHNGNHLLSHLLANGLTVVSPAPDSVINKGARWTNIASHSAPFCIHDPDRLHTKYDLWALYYHFDPRVGIKRCRRSGLEIVNQFGDPNWIVNADLLSTLKRKWIPDPERKLND
jgi:hypothetical protein